MTSLPHCPAPAALPPESWTLSSPRVRDRQMAVSYLQAAATTADADERSFLRRRAAELILPLRNALSPGRLERGA